MKLSKASRKALYEAKTSIWITWPGPHPRKGKTYRVSLKEGKSFGIIIEGCKLGGTEVLAKIHDDPFRPNFGLKGTRNKDGDYESEPERVSEEWESQLAQAAHLRSIANSTDLRQKEKKETLERELQIAKQRNRAGRTRKLEAQLSQEARRAA